MQHQDPERSHPGMPGQRLLPVVRREVPLPRVNLRGNARLLPPGVRDREKLASDEKPGIEKRSGQSLPADEGVQISLRRRPHAVGHLRERCAEAGRAADQPGSQLLG